jgi:hypothetical protein
LHVDTKTPRLCRQQRGAGAAPRIGRSRRGPRAAGEGGIAATNGERDHGSGHRLIVAVADFDNRHDRGLLLDDVDSVLAGDDDDSERGLREQRSDPK